MEGKYANVSKNYRKGMSCTMLTRKCGNLLVYMWGVISGE